MLQKGLPAFLTFLILFFPGLSQGQECTTSLRGIVEDGEGESLVGATLWIEALSTGAATDENGSFSINLCPGQYSILIKYVGYEDQRVSIRIPSSRLLVVKMKPSVNMLHDVVVEGTHLTQHSQSQALSILSESELILHKGKALGELLTGIPGVSSIMSGPAIFKPVINGLHSQRILVLNNGVRQEGQQWGVEHAPEVDTYIASEIEVVKGAEAVRFGPDAMGGAIILNTIPLHYSSSLGGELNAVGASNNRSASLSGMLEGGLKKHSSFGWRVQGSVKKGGDYHAPDYNLSNTGAEELNFSLTTGYKKNKNELEIYLSTFNATVGILRAAHTGNLSDLQNSIVNEEPWYVAPFSYHIGSPRQEIGHHLLKARFKKVTSAAAMINVHYAFQINKRKEFDVRRDRRNVPALSLDLYTHQLDGSFDFGKGLWKGSAGFNSTLKFSDNLTSLNLLPDYTQFNLGLFLFEKFRKDKWLFEAGVRADHQDLEARMISDGELVKPTFNFNYFAGSLGGAFFFNPGTRLTMNVGYTKRPPHVSELYSQGLHHGTASIEEGLMVFAGAISLDEKKVIKESSYKWITSLQIQRKRLSADLTGYINYFNDYVYLSPSSTRLTIRGYFPVFAYRQTDAILWGTDLSVDYNFLDKFTYSGRASFINAREFNHDGRLPLIPPAQVTNSITYSIPVAGKWKQLSITGRLNSVFRQSRAPKTVYPRDVINTTQGEIFEFMPAPDAYSLLGFVISSSLPMGNKDLTISVTADNVLNATYRNYMNRLRYYADDTGANFTLRINYKFHSHH